MAMDEVTYENVLLFYKKIPMQIFWSYYGSMGKKHPSSFKVIYEKKGKETYWIESRLYQTIVK